MPGVRVSARLATPAAHPALPLDIIPPCSPNVKYDNKAAARQTDMSKPCMLASCVPGGPGMIYRLDLAAETVEEWLDVPDAGGNHHDPTQNYIPDRLAEKNP